jgi:hypothetical protein
MIPMKRFLAIVAVIALIFALSVPAFAAEPSVVPGQEAGNAGTVAGAGANGANGANGAGAAGGNAAGGAAGTSPQTGYDVVAWTVAVSALVMGAGYCLISARKVTE